MSRRVSALLVCMLLCAGCATRAAARDAKDAGDAKDARGAKEAPASTSEAQTWTASSVVRSDTAFRITYYWSKGPRLRAETMIGIRPIVTIVAGDRYWVYDELGRTGLEIERAPAAVREDAERTRPFANDLEELIARGGERVETNAIDGVPVEVWRLTNTAGRRTIWVTASEPKLPVRIENFDRESGQIATLEYSGWRSGVELPDRAFAPPADLELQRYDYETFLRTAIENDALGRAPVLYPSLLHGPRPD
jgi:outer membrane lipoprotein-sorting protein